MKATLVSIEEAARTINVNPKTLIRWEEQGYISPIREDKQGKRYYSFENIAQLCELKRSPYFYYLQMDNMGTLPEKIRVVGAVAYDEGGARIIDGNNINDLCTVSSTLPGTVCYYTNYKKDIISKDECVMKNIWKHPYKMIYLKNFSQENKGFISMKGIDPIDLYIPKEKDACAVFNMNQIWKNDREISAAIANHKSICPKTMFGFECYEEANQIIGRHVKYKRFEGREWLAEDE